jgi:hypothetical protein
MCLMTVVSRNAAASTESVLTSIVAWRGSLGPCLIIRQGEPLPWEPVQCMYTCVSVHTELMRHAYVRLLGARCSCVQGSLVGPAGDGGLLCGSPPLSQIEMHAYLREVRLRMKPADAATISLKMKLAHAAT